MNLRELAQIANVSPSTVSKAFSNADDISDETRQYIFSIAKKHGCFGKYYKRKFPKKIIAILCPEISSDYYYNFVNQLQTRLEKINCLTVISTTDFSPSKQAELVDYYSSYLQVDGIITFGLSSKLKKGYDTPIISIGHSEDENVDAIYSDTYPAIIEAIKYLKDNGHTKIAFIGENLTSKRLIYFRRAMTENGLIPSSDDIVVCTQRFENAGKLGVQQLLDNNTDATAIFCAYDYIALGAIKQLIDKGYSVPEDFSVIGIDNINVSKYISRSLTTIDSHTEEQCRIICELMKKKLENKFSQNKSNIHIKSDLIIRDTVCKRKEENGVN